MDPGPHYPLLASERCSLADSNFVLGNAQVAGLFPVVYCSDGFCDLTGFSRAEVMQRGCACSFLYGPDTSELVRQQIRKALDEHKEFKAELILYRKSGEGPPGQPASPLHSPPAWQPSLPILTFSIPSFHPSFPHSHLPFLHPTSAFTLIQLLILGSLPQQENVLKSVGQICEHTCLTVIPTVPCAPLPCSTKTCPNQRGLPLPSQDPACVSAVGVADPWVSVSLCHLGQNGEWELG